MKKFLSFLIILTMLVTAVPAMAETTEDASFINYTNLIDFSSSSDDVFNYGFFKPGYRYTDAYVLTQADEADTKYSSITQYKQNDDGTTTPGSPSKHVMQYSVDVSGTTPIVVDYEIYCTGTAVSYSPQCSTIGAPGSATGTYNGFDGNGMAASALYSGGKKGSYHYQIIINPTTKYATVFIDGVNKGEYNLTAAYNSETQLLHLAHTWVAYAKELDGTRWIQFKYMAIYNMPEVTAFKVIDCSSTEATVQFNAPVTESTLTNMKAGDIAVASYENVSSAYDEANVYKLTFSSVIPGGIQTLSANGVTTVNGAGITDTESMDIPAISYLAQQKFNVLSTDNFAYNGLFARVKHANATYLSSAVIDDSTRFYALNNYQKTMLASEISLEGTNKIVVDYSLNIKGGDKWYAPIVSYTSNESDFTTLDGNAIGNNLSDAVNYPLSTTYASNWNPIYSYYRFIIDPVTKTITGYVKQWNDTGDTKTSSYEKTLDSAATEVYLGHCFRVWYSADKYTEKYLEWDYLNIYEVPSSIDFVVYDYDATGATVQFNAPVDESTLTNMKAGDIAVSSYENISEARNESNIYKLTFANALKGGTHALTTSGVTTLDGTAINASKNIKVKEILTKRVIASDGTEMYGIENILIPTSVVTDATVEYSGENILMSNTDGSKEGTVRLQTPSLGVQTGKLVMEFDIESCWNMTALRIKYGTSWGATNSGAANAAINASAGTDLHVKILYDFTTEIPTYTEYRYADDKEVSVRTGSFAAASDNAKSSKIFLNFSRIAVRDQTAEGIERLPGVVTLKNVSVYQPVSETFTVYNEGDNLYASHPVDIVETTATANGKEVGVVRIPETSSEMINVYQIDTSELEAGTYNVTVNPVAVDGRKAESISYTLTLDGNAQEFSNFEWAETESGKTITVTVKNNRNHKKEFTMIAAEYVDNNGIPTLVSEAYAVKKIGAFDEDTFTFNYVPEQEGSYVKAFVWSSFDGMKPYVEALAE